MWGCPKDLETPAFAGISEDPEVQVSKKLGYTLAQTPEFLLERWLIADTLAGR